MKRQSSVAAPSRAPKVSLAARYLRLKRLRQLVQEAERSAFRMTSNSLPVPEITRRADIKLNRRLSLRRHPRTLSRLHRTFFPKSGPTVAKPSGDHIPLGGFVHLNPATFHRDNGLIISETHLEQQKKSVAKPERDHRQGYQDAVIPPVR
jgi:hypothetical protein